MAGKLNLSKGFAPDYPWKNQGQAGADYYAGAAEHGEAPGQWWGRGAEALGLATGSIVDRKPYDLVYKERLDPRDGVSKLGRSPVNAQLRAEKRYQELLAGHPHATADEKRLLRQAAATATRQGPLYFDATYSLSKSLSIFHASLGENLRLAKERGDTEAIATWGNAVRDSDQMLMDAVRAGFDYFQEEAGYVRTGYHGGKVHGKETGKFERGDLIGTHWLQMTSRDGDPQRHVHGLIAHTALSHDGKWRAPDSFGYNEHIGAVNAIITLRNECALTRRFGLEWSVRPDCFGYEITGVAPSIMNLFSSRRTKITADTAERAARFEEATGRKPTQREAAVLGQRATMKTRKGKPEGEIDTDKLHTGWAAQLLSAHGERLADIAPDVSDLGHGGTRARRWRHPRGPNPIELQRAAEKALALAQAESSVWTRGQFIAHLAHVMPPSVRAMRPDKAIDLLFQLTEEALAGKYGDVRCLEAPEVVPTPERLLRDDGRSVYRRHGGTRYTTQVHLGKEERLVRRASRGEAPHMERAACAALIGAHDTDLAAHLHGRAADARDEATESGLRMDQGASLAHALSSDRRVSIITGPAGTGKTFVLAAGARFWAETGHGPVVGIAPSQAATHVLREAGVRDSVNSAKFLAEITCGKRSIAPGTLILMDEASMTSLDHVAEIVALAEKHQGKVLMAGDQEQLAAVEFGGAMKLLADELGFVQLGEPTRFAAAWEQDASLRLRAGDATVLQEYDIHGRIVGGMPDQAMDAAAKACVARILAGEEVLLVAQQHEMCHELSRRVRDELVHLGLVNDTASTKLRGGQRASVGDLIINRKNRHNLTVGADGSKLANGDVLRIEEIRDGEIRVRKLGEGNPVVGYGGQQKVSDLGYSVTAHSAQGRTVLSSLVLVTGQESRQWLYVAMSRGRFANIAYVFSASAKIAEVHPQTRPAPELERRERVEAEHAGLPVPATPEIDDVTTRDPISVLTDVVERDGSELAATTYRRRELADADHLALLNSILEGETKPARHAGYARMLAEAVPTLDLTHQVRWLFRSLDGAEAAGLHPRDVIGRAVAMRSLTGAKDVASVLDSRIRRLTANVVPVPAKPWSERELPEFDDPERGEYVRKVAAAMDARKERLGQFVTDAQPVWLVNALGPAPEHPLDRLEYTSKAADLAAYRELHNYDNPTDAIGPEPSGDSPAKRQAYHSAFVALGPVDGIDVRKEAGGRLHLIRDSYQPETAWAPRYVAEELRQARLGRTSSRDACIHAEALAKAARERGDEETAARHALLAASSKAMESIYAAQEEVFADAHEARLEWQAATAQARMLAVAADAELRRRHPDIDYEPLKSFEPEPATDGERAELEPIQGQEDEYQTPQWVTELAERSRAFREKLADRQSVMMPAEDPDYEPEGQAFPSLLVSDPEAILQAPKPQLEPAPEVERVAELEAQ